MSINLDDPTVTVSADLAAHEADLANPHSVTFAQLGSFALTSATPSDPTGTASATPLMMGLGLDGWIITPTQTGKVKITITGIQTNSSLNDGVGVQMRYGTGTAPSNGDAPTGTIVGALIESDGNDQVAGNPWSLTFTIPSLSVSTAYWFDVTINEIGGGTATITDLTVEALELP